MSPQGNSISIKINCTLSQEQRQTFQSNQRIFLESSSLSNGKSSSVTAPTAVFSPSCRFYAQYSVWLLSPYESTRNLCVGSIKLGIFSPPLPVSWIISAVELYAQLRNIPLDWYSSLDACNCPFFDIPSPSIPVRIRGLLWAKDFRICILRWCSRAPKWDPDMILKVSKCWKIPIQHI